MDEDVQVPRAEDRGRPERERRRRRGVPRGDDRSRVARGQVRDGKHARQGGQVPAGWGCERRRRRRRRRRRDRGGRRRASGYGDFRPGGSLRAVRDRRRASFREAERPRALRPRPEGPAPRRDERAQSRRRAPAPRPRGAEPREGVLRVRGHGRGRGPGGRRGRRREAADGVRERADGPQGRGVRRADPADADVHSDLGGERDGGRRWRACPTTTCSCAWTRARTTWAAPPWDGYLGADSDDETERGVVGGRPPRRCAPWAT